ncbi:MAG: hypothetical protein KBD06_03360 [Candidatus Pacebacteria bacterium]|nr:hypothetical protein [Candidatus Paceibacterota bacterium]
MLAQYVPLSGPVSGQNILNALNRAVKPPRGSLVQWQRSGARTSCIYGLLKAVPTSTFRRKKNAPKLGWNVIPGAHLQVSHTSGFINPDLFYTGTIRIEVKGRDDTETIELQSEIERIVQALPKQLPCETSAMRPGREDV